MEEIAQEIPQEQTNIPQGQNLETPKKKPKKWLIPTLITALILSLSVAGYFAYRYFQPTGVPQEQKQDTPKSVFPTSETDPTSDWKSYTHIKFADRPEWKIPWEGFTLHYPSSWKLSETKDMQDTLLNVKITKDNGDYIQIIQAASGGGWCLFPDQEIYDTAEGMITKFTNYLEIDKDNQLFWRLADWPVPGDLWSHKLCEDLGEVENPITKYKDSTIIGFFKIKVTTQETYQELIEILKKIEITN